MYFDPIKCVCGWFLVYEEGNIYLNSLGRKKIYKMIFFSQSQSFESNE